MSEDGKKLWEKIKEQFLLPALFHPNNPNAPHLSVYFDGYREALRMLYNSATNHHQYINRSNNAGS